MISPWGRLFRPSISKGISGGREGFTNSRLCPSVQYGRRKRQGAEGFAMDNFTVSLPHLTSFLLPLLVLTWSDIGSAPNRQRIGNVEGLS
jgi:hypothetical protein